MSEEEIKDVIQDLRYDVMYAKNKVEYTKSEIEKICMAFMNCIDLYNKEKEKNKELEKQLEDKDWDISINRADAMLDWDKFWKDKIRQEIKELEQHQKQLQLARVDLIYSAEDIIRHQILLLEDILEE